LLSVTIVTVGNCFPAVWELLPSAFGVGQYFPNIGETISNSDLNTSQYLYINYTDICECLTISTKYYLVKGIRVAFVATVDVIIVV